MESKPVVYIVGFKSETAKAIGRLVQSVGLVWSPCASATQFFENLDENCAGCAITRLSSSPDDALSIQVELNRRDLPLSVVVLTDSGDISGVVAVMKLGAVDVLTMPYNEQELLEATQHAIRRSRTRKQEGIATAEARTRIAKLSPRERDVLHLIAGGYRTPAIAEKLRLKPKTVESYRASIVAKTATSSIAELVRLALLADESQFRAGRNPHA